MDENIRIVLLESYRALLHLQDHYAARRARSELTYTEWFRRVAVNEKRRGRICRLWYQLGFPLSSITAAIKTHETQREFDASGCPVRR